MKFLAVLLLTLSTQLFAQGNITIYDANCNIGLGSVLKNGKIVVQESKPMVRKVPKSAVVLFNQLEKIQKYYFVYHKRNSWDDQGSDIEATINIRGIMGLFGMRQNAAWIGPIRDKLEDMPPMTEEEILSMERTERQFVFGKGRKWGLDNFEGALDVVAHEFTHAVIDSSSKLKYRGQSGALNEHLADVFGVLINIHYNNPKNPFLIGSTVSGSLYNGRPLRDLEHPHLGISAQPGHMDDLNNEKFRKYVDNCIPDKKNDQCGVHILSGIPNKMAVTVIKNLTPVEATSLFYNVMTKHLKPNSDFMDYKAAMMSECKSISSRACLAVEAGFASVGL